MSTSLRTSNTDTALIEEYYNHGIVKKEIRSYEVSLWTLQDSFITVLKWSDVEQIGRIENPKMTLNVDGTEKFTFSIPMYYRENGVYKENPNWYTVSSGKLIEGMRKIKVIFNKDESANKRVFEFLITKVTETHENDILTCSIETEGLAFQELGKIGYKYSLSQDNFELDYKEWQENGSWKNIKNESISTKPIENIQYWCEEGCGLEPYPSTAAAQEAINPRTWYYTIQMNWKSFENGHNRSSKKVYEEAYPISWNDDDPTIATAFQSYREKARSISAENSNLYNLTQTIAEQFGVFCRYEYLHDDNNQITGRLIIFYNNFSEEENGYLSLTYPYSASKNERVIDSTEITTKLYVLSTDNEYTLDGINSIMNAPANNTMEDYILNFDYLSQIGAITSEQKSAINPYKKSMRSINKVLSKYQQQLSTYEKIIPEEAAKNKVYSNSIDLDQEQIDSNSLLRNELDSKDGVKDGYITITGANSDYRTIITDSTSKKSYINMTSTNKGIKPSSILVFLRMHTKDSGVILTNPIKKYKIEYDDYNNITKLVFDDSLNLSSYDITDWASVYDKYYKPTSYNGNANLWNRIVYSKSTIQSKYSGYSYDYTTVCVQYKTYTASDNKQYDVVYSALTDNGTLLSNSQVTTYFNSILKNTDTIAKWKESDAADKKIILKIAEVDNANNHQASWIDEVEKKQQEWDTIRKVNKWFGYNDKNPDNVTIGSQTHNYATKAQITAETRTMAVNTAYLTYSYEPKLYYDNIIKTWQVKLAKDSNKLKNSDKKLGPKTDDDASFNYSQFGYESVAQAYTDLKGYYYKKAQIEDKIDEQIALKRAAIQAFERTMGPAIREGYWQPEDYTDYGDEYTYESLITQNDITADSGNEAIIAWDTELFDDEDPIYYQIGVNQVTEYYPCLDLTMIFTANNITNIPTDLDEYSILWKATYYSDDTTYDFDDLKDIQIMAVGSKALIRYMKDGNTIKPILVLIGAKTFTPSQLERLILTGDARIEKYSTEVVNSELQIHHDNIKNIPPEAWLCYRRRGNTTLANEGWSNDLLNKYELLSNNTTKQNVLPRIKFSSLSLKTNSSNLVIELVTTKNNNETKHLLTMAEDYYVNTRDTKRTSTTYYLEYYITIKPETLIKYGYDIENTKVRVQYVLSNANTAIFLDAQKISKENAFPKVSYNVTTNLLNPGLTHTLYNTLAQIIMINDIDLKFEDVFGYISQVDLDLDQPQQDTVEIKNYSTKFEDLFSTIVASTESMKKNEGRLSMAMGGDIPLTSDALGESLSNAGNVFDAYLDSHFDTSEVVINKLADIFSEAGKILGESKKSLQKLSALTLDNANILSGFAQNVMAELTGQVFRSAEKPMSFSPGDIWIQEDEHGNIIARYVATSRSEDLNDTTGTNGFVRTYDGKLASITGASLNVNADDGIIDITAKNNINIMSGGYLYLASNDIDIVGNHSVNIGGATINIATLTEEGETYEAGGINLISTSMQNGISVRSEVLLSPFSITMGAADIFMRGGRKIQMVTSDGSSANTSAIELSPETGIWIGSGKGLRLFGGGFVYDADTAELSTPVGAQGASVELNSEHLILGYANTASNTGTAIEMTEGGMILAAGNYLDHGIWEKNHYYSANTIVLYNGKYYRCIIAHSSGETWQQSNWTEYEFVINGTTSGLIGAKFTANSIGFATMSTVDETTYINAILMDDTNGITIGSGTSTHPLDITAATQTLRNSSGSYVRISSDGIDLGSLSDLYINSNNFKLQTNVNESGKQTVLAIGSNLQVVNDKTVYDATNGQFGRKNDDDSITLYSAGNQPAIDLIINQKGLYLTGTVYATAGSFTGTVTATSFTTNENSSRGYFKADNTAVGFFRKNDNNVENILTLDTSGKITADKALTISAADGLTISSTSKIAIISGADINITSTNFVVNSEASGNSNLFFAGLTSSDIPNFSSNTVYSVGAMVQYSNKYYQFINAHAAGTWKAADVKEIALPSMTLNTTNGLTIVGKINANELQIEGSDGESWVQSKVTDSFIWMGVKNATAGTSLELTDTKMTLSSNNTSILIDSTKGIEIKGRTIKIMGAPADNDNSAVSGTLYVSTDNVIINTAATTTNAILRIGSENDPAILYSLSNGLTIKGKITALAGGTIGGWNIGSTGLTSGNMGIYSSGTYSINSNNAFMVDFNGNVWLNSLKVWNGSSYDTINLSGNFNEAVSYASGAWSGSEFIATLKLFKNDRITKEVKLQASVVDPIVELDWDASSRTATYSVGVDLQIGGVSHASSQAGYFWFEDRTLLWQYSDPIFESGWAAAADFTAEYDADHISFTGLPTNTVDDFSGTISAADPYAAGYKKGWKDCKTVCAGSTNTYYTGTPRLIRPSGASQDIWVIENYTEVSVTEYNDPGDPS